MAGITDMRGIARLWRLVRGAMCVAPLAVAACGEVSEAPETGMRIAVRPLALEPVLRVCYDLSVQDALGMVLWQAGDPNVSYDNGDNGTLCSDVWGTGSGGDIQYIGSCDTNNNPNIVSLVIDGIYTIDGRLVDGVDWLPTCTAAEPCRQYVQCAPDDNVLVNFDVVVMREANQGFFDIAVTFDDIFCSAKVDCTYDAEGDEPIMAVHDGDKPVNTAVVGLACTAGPDTTEEDIQSVLLVNDVRIQCGEIGAQSGSVTNLWACTPDGSETFGFGLAYGNGAVDIQGVSVSRQSPPGTFPASFQFQPFLPTNLDTFTIPFTADGRYTRTVMFRTFADAPSGEGIVVMVDPTLDFTREPPFAHMHLGTAVKSGTEWSISSTAPVPFPDWRHISPKSYDADAKSLIATTSFESFGFPDGAIIRYQMVDGPGGRSFGGLDVWNVPAGLTDCVNVHASQGAIIAECRREQAGVPGFEAVLWVIDTNNARNEILGANPEVSDPFHRTSQLTYAGHLRTDDGSLVIASNARFQWTDPGNNDDWTADTDVFAVIWGCSTDGSSQCTADDSVIAHADYRSHKHFTPEAQRKPTHVKGIVDQFVFGKLGYRYQDGGQEVLEVGAAIYEYMGSTNWHLAWQYQSMTAVNGLNDTVTVPPQDIDIEGIYPGQRTIWGRIGPTFPYPGLPGGVRYWYLADIPPSDLQMLQPRAMPLVLPTGYADFVGTIGPEQDRRMLMQWLVDDGSNVTSALIELQFDPGMQSVSSYSWVVPLLGLPPDDVMAVGAWDIESLRESQARDGFHQSSYADLMWPVCGQVFGSVSGLPGGGDQPAIIDPDIDLVPDSGPDPTPEAVIGTIGSFETAAGWPLDAPSWLSGDWLGTVIINPAGPNGNFWHFGDPVMNLPANPRPPGTPDIHLNHAIYRGVEQLSCGGLSCNKLYWNVAVGFDPNVPNCTLYFDATAAAASSLVGGTLPEDSYWPWLAATVPLTGPDAGTGDDNLICRQHPMGSPQYPAVARHMDEPAKQACHAWDGIQVTTLPECTGPEYWLRYREWDDAGP
jgi:hypothetical protein